MPSAAIFEISLGIIGLFFSGVFLLGVEKGGRRGAFYKFSAALTLFSVMVLTQVVEATWDVITISSIVLPPLHVMFEALILGFLVSGLWDLVDES